EVMFAALLFVDLARLGGLAFGALGGLAHSADKRLFFRDLALLGFAQAGVVERVHARPLFFLGEAAPHPTPPRLAGRGAWRQGRERPGWSPRPLSVRRTCRWRDAWQSQQRTRPRRPSLASARGFSPSRRRPPWCGRG